MPYFWDKTPETVPQPELNPLSNPALERNLSRWAEAYFSNPPGKREQAISRLLEEIKNETSEILVAEQARRESSIQSSAENTAATASGQPLETSSPRKEFVRSASAEKPNAICPVCKSENPSGNKFCGQCGAGIQTGRSVAGDNSHSAGVLVPATSAPSNRDNPDSYRGSGDDVQWLRDRSLGSLYAADAPPRQGWKYALAGLTILLAAFAYLQWGPSLWTWLTPPSTAVAPAATTSGPKVSEQNPSSAAIQKPPQTTPSGSAKPDARAGNQGDSNRREPMSAAIQPASQKASLLRVNPGRRQPRTSKAESASYSLRNVISEAAWAPAILRKPPSCCGKRCGSRTLPPRFCCPDFTRAATAFPGTAIRRGCCWLRRPSGGSAGGGTVAQSGIPRLPVEFAAHASKEASKNKNPAGLAGSWLLERFSFSASDRPVL